MYHDYIWRHQLKIIKEDCILLYLLVLMASFQSSKRCAQEHEKNDLLIIY